MKQAPQIVEEAKRLLVAIDRAVDDFPQKARYLLGQDLRRDAMDAALLAQQAFLAARQPALLLEHLQALAKVTDRMRLAIQLAHERQCIQNWNVFNALARSRDALGRQCGGWIKEAQKHLQGQNPAAFARRERPETLSAQAASAGANP